MTDFSKPEAFNTQADAAGVTHVLAASTEQVKAGTRSRSVHREEHDCEPPWGLGQSGPSFHAPVGHEQR